MSVKTALYSYLTTVAGLTTLTSTRIYPDANTSGTVTLPYIVFAKTSNNHEHHMAGASGLASPRYEFNIYGATADSAEDTAEQLRLAMDGFVDATTGAENLSVRRVWLETEDDGYVPPNDAKQPGVFAVRMDFIVWHLETVPTF